MVRSSRPRICRAGAPHKQLMLRIWHAHYAYSTFFQLKPPALGSPGLNACWGLSALDVLLENNFQFGFTQQNVVPALQNQPLIQQWNTGNTDDQEICIKNPLLVWTKTLVGILHRYCCQHCCNGYTLSHIYLTSLHMTTTRQRRGITDWHVVLLFPDWCTRSYILAHLLR